MRAPLPQESSTRAEKSQQFSSVQSLLSPVNYEQVMSGPAPPTRPGLPWRLASVAVMSSVGALSRGFLYGFNNVEVIGLNNLLRMLDKRKAPENRQRGLLTVCNHVGVYGLLPLIDPPEESWTDTPRTASTTRSYGASSPFVTPSMSRTSDGVSAPMTYASRTSASRHHSDTSVDVPSRVLTWCKIVSHLPSSA